MAKERTLAWILSYQTTCAIKTGRASLIPVVGEEALYVSRGYNLKRGLAAAVRCQDGVVRQVPWNIFDGDFKHALIRRVKATFIDGV